MVMKADFFFFEIPTLFILWMSKSRAGKLKSAFDLTLISPNGIIKHQICQFDLYLANLCLRSNNNFEFDKLAIRMENFLLRYSNHWCHILGCNIRSSWQLWNYKLIFQSLKSPKNNNHITNLENVKLNCQNSYVEIKRILPIIRIRNLGIIMPIHQ